MNEDSSRLPQKQGLKNEWSLLIHSFIESSDQEKETVLNKIKSLGLTKADLKNHAKNLSETRKNLNLRIENIKAEMDRLGAVTSNLELVGSDTNSIQERIDKLNSDGELLSLEVTDVEKKIKKIRAIQEAIISSNHLIL